MEFILFLNTLTIPFVLIASFQDSLASKIGLGGLASGLVLTMYEYSLAQLQLLSCFFCVGYYKRKIKKSGSTPRARFLLGYSVFLSVVYFSPEIYLMSLLARGGFYTFRIRAEANEKYQKAIQRNIEPKQSMISIQTAVKPFPDGRDFEFKVESILQAAGIEERKGELIGVAIVWTNEANGTLEASYIPEYKSNKWFPVQATGDKNSYLAHSGMIGKWRASQVLPEVGLPAIRLRIWNATATNQYHDRYYGQRIVEYWAYANRDIQEEIGKSFSSAVIEIRLLPPPKEVALLAKNFAECVAAGGRTLPGKHVCVLQIGEQADNRRYRACISQGGRKSQAGYCPDGKFCEVCYIDYPEEGPPCFGHDCVHLRK